MLPITLTDINFGGGTPTNSKAGFAAVGQATNDYWNYVKASFSATLTNADRSTSSVSITLSNAHNWGNNNSSTDPMFASDVYSGSASVPVFTIGNLQTGLYWFYIYGQNGNFQLSVSGTNYGTNTTDFAPIVNPTVWQQGAQYVLFTNVLVAGGQTVTVTANNTKDGTAYVSGIQIALLGQQISIASQPTKQTVCAGSSATFTLADGGMPLLNYQWLKDGTNVAGATGSAYTIPSLSPGDAGTYSVMITDLYWSATSTGAVLTVTTSPPTLTLRRM